MHNTIKPNNLLQQQQQLAKTQGPASTGATTAAQSYSAVRGNGDSNSPAKPAGVPGTTDDSVKLTDSGKALSQASTAGDSIDTKRVESIRASLANGSYKIDASNIADKLTSLEGQIGSVSP
jgi:negative regulator of flagellin synthesis FlgM